MKRLNFSVFESNPKQAMDEVCKSNSPKLIKRPDGEPVVLMSHREYRPIEETMYLMQSPKNAMRLMNSIKELEAGRGIVVDMPIDELN